jgi:hypothetical protein
LKEILARAADASSPTEPSDGLVLMSAGARCHAAHRTKIYSPDCEVGAAPPFGGVFGFPVIADETLADWTRL